MIACLAAAALLAAPSRPGPGEAAAIQRMRVDFYRYDRALPLNATITPLDTNETRTRYRVDYDSVHDQRVPAILAVPAKFHGPFGAVILIHGSGGNKDTSYIQWTSEALTAVGYATISIDTQYHGDRERKDRSGDIHMPDSYTMRDAWVQSVIDMRRAVDYLQSRSDIDRRRIGYLGFSQGGMLGGVLGGVEPRIHCFCLCVPGAGIVNLVKHIDRYPVLKAYWPVHRTAATMATVEDIANITDPLYYVGGIAPRPMLIVTAVHDEIIPPEASAAFVRAAHARPGQVLRVRSGHVLSPTALFPVRAFFVRTLGPAHPL